MMKKKYPKNHPLWPVWDLQRQVLKRGGKIDKNSDLLAVLEGFSLNPTLTENRALFNLVNENNKLSTNGLYSFSNILYKKQLGLGQLSPLGQHSKFWKIEKLKADSVLGENCKLKLDSKKNEFSDQCKLLDNQLVLNGPGFDILLTFNRKYSEIIRIIKRGYPPYFERSANKLIIPAIILAAGLIIAALLYAYSNRFEVRNYNRIDKWKGTIERLEPKQP